MFLRQPRGLSGGLCWERGTRAQRGRGREKAREREQERKAQNTLQLEVGKRKEFQRFVFFFLLLQYLHVSAKAIWNSRRMEKGTGS